MVFTPSFLTFPFLLVQLSFPADIDLECDWSELLGDTVSLITAVSLLLF